MGLAIAFYIFIAFQLGSAQTPPRPQLSNSFSTEVTELNAGIELKATVYFNFEEKKALQIVGLGSDGAGTGHVHLLILQQSNKMYQFFDSFGFCTVEPNQGMLVGLWSWLQNATFKGKQEFMGKQVDVWAYESNDLTYEAGVLSSDRNQAVYRLSNVQSPQVFSNYSNSAPPDSKFTIPSACAKSAPQDVRLHPRGPNPLITSLFKH